MAHILFKVGVKRTQSITGILRQTSRFRFGSPAANKAIYIKPEADGIPLGSDEV
jgi:hypothetical protein